MYIKLSPLISVQNFVPSQLRVTSSSEQEVEIVWEREPCNEDELFIKSYNFQFSLGESFFPSQMVESGQSPPWPQWPLPPMTPNPNDP